MNNRCPYCDAPLEATIVVLWENVPLGKERFVLTEGELGSTDVGAVQCTQCQWAGPGAYYYTKPQAEIDFETLLQDSNLTYAEIGEGLVGAFYRGINSQGLFLAEIIEAQGTNVIVSPVGSQETWEVTVIEAMGAVNFLVHERKERLTRQEQNEITHRD